LKIVWSVSRRIAYSDTLIPDQRQRAKQYLPFSLSLLSSPIKRKKEPLKKCILIKSQDHKVEISDHLSKYPQEILDTAAHREEVTRITITRQADEHYPIQRCNTRLLSRTTLLFVPMTSLKQSVFTFHKQIKKPPNIPE
jgi:hypothetical protein